MTRTFSTLAICLILAMLATIAIGFCSFALSAESQWKNDVFIIHFYLGLFTALAILLVHCLIFTYFLGTGRWVKEVGMAYDLPDRNLPRTTRELKRIVFPPALYAMLVAIGTAAAGAGAQLQSWPWYIHAASAFLTLGVNLWAFRVEHRCLRENAEVIGQVLSEVDRIRNERGLPSNAEALLED